jgi:hypothetical protein
MITILTDPVLYGGSLILELARKAGRLVRNKVKPPKYNFGRYRGHYAVTRSLIEGLKKADLPHNYNPWRLGQLAETVVVLAGVRTLRQAIELKRRGYIKKLLVGPNVVTFSSDYDNLLASPQVDAAITPCDWVVDIYLEDNPSLAGRIFSWPAGVDVDYWKPGPAEGRQNILIFEKRNKGPVGPVAPYAEFLHHKGYSVEIIRYGAFTHGDYLQALQRAQLMVGFVVDESQGLAWAEAWAADVPILIWRNEQNTYRGRTYRTSTAPYLASANGLFFDDLDHFQQQFARWEANPAQFNARDWTLTNMSDEVCARRLYEMVISC